MNFIFNEFFAVKKYVGFSLLCTKYLLKVVLKYVELMYVTKFSSS